MHTEQVKIILDKLDIFIIKYTDDQRFIFGQKKIQGLFAKDIFKVAIMEEVSNSIQVFDFYLINDIKNLCPNKVYKKNRLVMHVYND